MSYKHIHWAFSTQQSQWKYAFVCNAFQDAPFEHLCLYTYSLYTRNLYAQPGTLVHFNLNAIFYFPIAAALCCKRVWPIALCVLGEENSSEACKSQNWLLLGAELSHFQVSPSLGQSTWTGIGGTKFTDDENCCGNKMKCLPWNTGVKPDRWRSPILPEAHVIVPINSCWLHWGGWWLTNRQRAKSEVKDIDLEIIGIKSPMIQQTDSWRVGKKAFDKVYMIVLLFIF